MVCFFLLVSANLPPNGCRVLKGEGLFKGRGYLGNPKDSVWEDWGTLGKIRGITTPPLRILLNGRFSQDLDQILPHLVDEGVLSWKPPEDLGELWRFWSSFFTWFCRGPLKGLQWLTK